MEPSNQIYKAMSDAMKDITAIGKDKTNEQQRFKYRGIDDVYNALNPILGKHQIFILPEIQSCERSERPSKNGGTLFCVQLTIKYSFCTSDGSSVSCVVQGEAMDSGDKAINKAMSIAQKYALFQVFCIPTKDQELLDPDVRSPETAAAKSTLPVPPPKDLLARMFTNLKRFAVKDEGNVDAAMLARAKMNEWLKEHGYAEVKSSSELSVEQAQSITQWAWEATQGIAHA